jgi:alkanesulfonate monooxygenase SsuD/methylene tetrahydromethanopterin reductase-like flavin-dependent oxidoreductase (luciferase family)
VATPDPGSGWRAAVWLPLFDRLADPRLVIDLAVEAEASGWDGFFVWDHTRWREPVREVADPWVVLTAVAAATERLLLGPMVTPLARRRPVEVIRQTATLDRMSRGRLVLGVGLGSDRFGEEFSRFGEEENDAVRAAMLDEALDLIAAGWRGEPVRHRGASFVIDDVTFLPRPVQEPGVPVWVAGFPGRIRPRRRAARFQGFFPVNLQHPDELAEAMAAIAALRAPGPYDVAVELEHGVDPAPYAAAGATWVLTAIDPHSLGSAAYVADVRALVRAGPQHP